MAYLADLVEEELGAAGTEVNLWRATRNGQAHQFAQNLLDRYKHADLEPVPKRPGEEFRPACLSDYSGNETQPHQREDSFVSRALLYADGVAVQDELYVWDRLEQDRPNRLHSHFSEGFPWCNNAVAAARRICRYAELERNGLLTYVTPLERVPSTEIHGWLQGAEVKHLAPLVVEYAGFTREHAENAQAIMPHLEMWLLELFSLLGHHAVVDDYVDLYLPDWFPGVELLDWVARREGQLPNLGPEWGKRQSSLSRLFDLPTLTDEALTELTLHDMISFRDIGAFGEWRNELSDALEGLSNISGITGVQELHSRLTNAQSELHSKAAFSSLLKPRLGELFVAGVTIAASAVAQESLLPPISGALATTGGLIASRVARWLIVQRPSQQLAEAHYRVFAVGNSRGVFKPDRPRARPMPFMSESFTGRPIHWDPFGE